MRGNTLKTQSCAKEEKKKTTVKACEYTTTGTSSIERNKIMDEKKKERAENTKGKRALLGAPVLCECQTPKQITRKAGIAS